MAFPLGWVEATCLGSWRAGVPTPMLGGWGGGGDAPTSNRTRVAATPPWHPCGWYGGPKAQGISTQSIPGEMLTAGTSRETGLRLPAPRWLPRGVAHKSRELTWRKEWRCRITETTTSSTTTCVGRRQTRRCRQPPHWLVAAGQQETANRRLQRVSMMPMMLSRELVELAAAVGEVEVQLGGLLALGWR